MHTIVAVEVSPPIPTDVLAAVPGLPVKERPSALAKAFEAVRVSLIARRHMSNGALATKRLSGVEWPD